MTSAQLVIISLIWQLVSTTEVHFQANSRKHVKETIYTVVLSLELRYRFYNLLQYVLLCQINYMK